MKKFNLAVIFNAVDKITAPLKTIHGSVAKFQNTLTNVSKKFDSGMGKSAKIGLAADAVSNLKDQTMGLLAPAIGVGREFEKTMSKVGALARIDKTSEEFKNLEKTAEKLGETTSFSASQAAEGMTFLAMAGFKSNQIISAMPGMLSLAKAGNIDLARAADIASNTLGSFKMEASEMPRVSNAMAAAFTRSNVDLEMMAETFKYVAPVANAAGMSIESLAAMTGLLGDIGIQGSQAGTALRAGILRLATAPKPAAEALGELGIEAKDSSGNLRQLPDILEEIRIKTAGMGTGTRLEFIKKIFGMEASAAFTELISKADESGKSIKAFSKEIENAVANNEVDKIAKQMGENFDGATKELDSAKEALLLTIYKTLAPALTNLAKFGTKAFQWVGQFAKENPGLTKTIVGVIAAIAGLTAVLLPVLLTIAGLTAAVTTISAGWAIFTAAVAVAKTAFISFTAALLANPLTWVAIGVIALIAAIWLLVENWDEISDWFSQKWGEFSELADDTFHDILNYFEWLWEQIGNVASEKWSEISNTFSGYWESIKSQFIEWGNSIVSFFSGIWDQIAGVVSLGVSKVKNLIPDSIKSFFGGGKENKISAKGANLPTGDSIKGGAGSSANASASVDVNFANIPKGTRIKTGKPQKNINLSMGYSGASL